jgi:uncharacterized membrane protein YebE (DUF533 family)
MFNPEKMLGNLLMGGVRRKRGLGGLLSGGAALGLVGVAMEAAEHYLNGTKQTGSAPPADLPGGAPVGPPPIAGRPATPPPPPPGMAPAAPPSAVAGTSPTGDRAVLLIRAMIAAANADGVIDADERDRILARLEEARLSPEERDFMAAELSQPRTAEQIAAEVAVAEEAVAEVAGAEVAGAEAGAETARQVYLASLLAVEVDTPSERVYLESLAGLLGLDAAAVTELHQTATVSPDG